MKQQVRKLEELFGSLTRTEIIRSSWSEEHYRKKTVLVFEDKKVVLHIAHDLSAIERNLSYMGLLASKELIPEIYLLDNNSFATNYIEGKIISSKDDASIEDIANLQRQIHHQVPSAESFWNEYFNQVLYSLKREGVSSIENLPELYYSSFALTHGDFGLGNLVEAEKDLYAIDLEHFREGPVVFDVIRPLLRICSDKDEENRYLTTYGKGSNIFSREEINSGKIAFYVMQIYNRINKGFVEEAKSSISNLKKIMGD
jgi:thiamine kinase-like enzyme